MNPESIRDGVTIESLVDTISQALTRRNLKLVTAESCTGGWLAKVATDVAGSSGWFERGFVTYSNEAKIELLHVAPQTLQMHGAVSEQTAREMVLGALTHSRAEIAVAITGVAGPDGGTTDKPVGTVWIAWGRRGADATATRYVFDGNRDRVRSTSVVQALQGLLQFVE